MCIGDRTEHRRSLGLGSSWTQQIKLLRLIFTGWGAMPLKFVPPPTHNLACVRGMHSLPSCSCSHVELPSSPSTPACRTYRA